MRRMLVSEIRGMAVFTESGTALGTCKDVYIDMDTGRVLQFVVGKRLIDVGEHLLIGIEDVRDVTDDTIIVRDAFVGLGAALPA